MSRLDLDARKYLSAIRRNRSVWFVVGVRQANQEPNMKVMVFVKATQDSEAGILPTAKLLADMGKYNEELIKAGVMLAGDGLRPSAQGKRVLFSGSKRTVTDGPFAETRELVAGYWLWQVRSMEEAVEWLKRCPNPGPGEWVIEARPVFEAEPAPREA